MYIYILYYDCCYDGDDGCYDGYDRTIRTDRIDSFFNFQC